MGSTSAASVSAVQYSTVQCSAVQEPSNESGVGGCSSTWASLQGLREGARAFRDNRKGLIVCFLRLHSRLDFFRRLKRNQQWLKTSRQQQNTSTSPLHASYRRMIDFFLCRSRSPLGLWRAQEALGKGQRAKGQRPKVQGPGKREQKRRREKRGESTATR
jgi:hypothetical protein